MYFWKCNIEIKFQYPNKWQCSEKRILQNLLERNMIIALVSRKGLESMVLAYLFNPSEGAQWEFSHAKCCIPAQKKGCTSFFLRNIWLASRWIQFSTVVQLHTSFGACKHSLYFAILSSLLGNCMQHHTVIWLTSTRITELSPDSRSSQNIYISIGGLLSLSLLWNGLWGI